MEEEAKDEDAPEEMEPMEGDDKKLEAEAPWNPYEGDSGDYAGAGNLPAFLLSASCKQPYFGDMMRRNLIEHEFNHADKPENKDFEDACGMMDAAAESGSAKKEVFIAGCHGEEDMASITQMIADKADIMFPGCVAAWTTEENAKKALEGAGEHSGQKCTKVIYKVEATVLEAVHCRAFAHRLSAKIDSSVNDADTGTEVITLTAYEGDEALKAKMGKTIPDWNKAVEEAAKAAEAAAAAEGMEAAMGGEGMMEGEGNMEMGDGEMAAAE